MSDDDPDDGGLTDLVSASAWDVATRYHEFKAKKSLESELKKLRRLSARAILERAQAVLGSIVHPTEPRLSSLDLLPPEVDQAELDLEETLDSSAAEVLRGLNSSGAGLLPQDLWMSYATRKKRALVLSVDTSLSMTGEKLALTAVSLAVVLLQFPDDPIGIVAFENSAKVLKHPAERLSVGGLVERFLDVPAQGYTHLEEGMTAALNLQRRDPSILALGGKCSTLLLTDGKYTAGRDPAYLAGRFQQLVVIKMGEERSSLELCRELAQKGRGSLRQVGDLHHLPSVMYGAVKDLLRGRAVS